MTLDPSLKLLLEALDRTPDNAPLRLLVAESLERSSDVTGALAHFAQVSQEPTLRSRGKLGEARCWLALGRSAEAQANARAVCESEPLSAEAWLLLARSLDGHEPADDALAAYERAIELDPHLTDDALRLRLCRALGEARARLRVIEGGRSDSSAAPADRNLVRFLDVAGLEEVKEKIRMRIVYPFTNPGVFEAFGRRAGGGLLLYGPPGCGKTHLARATAGECGARFFGVGLHEILDVYAGGSERQLHAIFDEARRRAPSVLFFDEVDALGLKRSQLALGSMRGVITQLLTELDGFASRNERVLIIGATNTPWDLDPALRRPGRFSESIFVPPPGPDARGQILQDKLRGKPHHGIELGGLVSATEGWSGADVAAIADRLFELAIEESLRHGSVVPAGPSHASRALASSRSSAREWFVTARNYIRFANEGGQYDDVRDYMRQHMREL